MKIKKIIKKLKFNNDNSERKKYLSFLKQQRSLIDSEIKRIEGESHD